VADAGDGRAVQRSPAAVRAAAAGCFLLAAVLLVAALVYPLPAQVSCGHPSDALERALTVRRALFFGAFAATALALIGCAAGLVLDAQRVVWYAAAALLTLVLLVPLEGLEWFVLDPCGAL
jgi:hypothetical protein